MLLILTFQLQELFLQHLVDKAYEEAAARKHKHIQYDDCGNVLMLSLFAYKPNQKKNKKKRARSDGTTSSSSSLISSPKRCQ